MNKIKLTKLNREKYLVEFLALEEEYLLFLKNSISDSKGNSSKENFFLIWNKVKMIIQRSEFKGKGGDELPDLLVTSLPICFAFNDWVRFRLWLSEESLKIALGLSFYLGRVISTLNTSYEWRPYIADECKGFLGKNHPIMNSGFKECSPVSLVMHWLSLYSKSDEHFLKNEYAIINDSFKRIIQA